MGQREVLAVHEFSVMLWLSQTKSSRKANFLMMENAWFDFSFGMDKIEHSGRYFFTFY